MEGKRNMNGYECGVCDCAPCVCTERERRERIKEGTIVIESLWQAMAHLPVWKMKIIRWLWPDIAHVAKDMKEYHWKEN